MIVILIIFFLIKVNLAMAIKYSYILIIFFLSFKLHGSEIIYNKTVFPICFFPLEILKNEQVYDLKTEPILYFNKRAIDYLGEISSNPNELNGQDERHLSNMRADGNSWMTVYRKMDKTDTNPLVSFHLNSSKKKGYGFSQILNFSRCIDNELK